MEETSDARKTEQLSMCLRHVFIGVTKEAFIEFFSTNSTGSETVYKLVEEVFIKHETESI